MTHLCIYADTDRAVLAHHMDQVSIAQLLAKQGVEYAVWATDAPLARDATNDEVLAAHEDSIESLMERHGFQSADVVSLGPNHPDRASLRQKFLAEHTHDEFEVRFFVHGQGLFYLHIGRRVYALMCGEGDLISVPAGVPHWFDMGERPDFRCIRLFMTPDGWIANYTGSDISKGYPDFDTFLADLSA